MFKRIGLFLLTNILVIVTVSFILNFFGIGNYMTAYGLDYQALMVFCLVWGMVGSFISLCLSKWMAKMMMGVEIVSANGPYGDLVRRIHTLSRRAGLSVMPEVGIFRSPVINAFATGRGRNSSLVAVSTGLLDRMDDGEVEGVLAHEVAHIANGDMVTMALVQGVVNAFVMFLARVVAYFIQASMRSNDRNGGGVGGFAYIMTVFALEIVFGILASIIVMWFSRYREFRADAGSAALAGKDKMIRALEALKRDYENMQETNYKTAVQTMSISSKKGIMKLFSSHPDLDDRIRALERGTHR